METRKRLVIIVVLFSLAADTLQERGQCNEWQFETRIGNELQCIDCFCNSITSRCRRAMYYIAKIELSDVSKVRALSEDARLPENAIYFSASNEVILGDVDGLGTRVVYWVLPREFLGKQVFSYGGFLKYSVFYDVVVNSSPYRAADVIIRGPNKQTIVYKEKELLFPKTTKDARIQIVEKNFYLENGSEATRRDVMRVLLDIKKFLIRATYAKETRVTLLNSVSLDTTTPYYTKYGRSKYVEHCLCSEGYHGFSCEDCQRGYTRDQSLSGTKSCIRCQCNRHTLECHPENGICKNCQDNTLGDHCEKCQVGYYGDATRGTTEDCRRCACPLRIDSNQFSPTCRKMEDGLVTCTACQEGYTGRDCGKCAKGYAGNPRYPGGKCIKTSRRVDRVPRISVKPTHRLDPIGYRAIFRCEASGTGPFHITWSRKDARPLPVGRSRVFSRGSEWILIISSLRVDDAGDYVCSARSHFGIASYRVSLKIYANKVTKIAVSVTPKSLRVAEGASALFLCNVNTALLTISRSWSRDGYRLLPETAEVVDGTLAFRNARREDSGVYTCSASNQVTVDSATVIISVGALIGPQISLWPLTQTVDVGKPVNFQCTATGFPKPEIFWSKSGNKQDEGFRYIYSNNGILSIGNVRDNDEGEYVCTARNKVGEISRKAILFVRAPNRKLSISVFPEKIKVKNGEKVTLKCAASGQPEPSINWNFRKGQNVRVHGGTLAFPKVSLSDNGVYLCTASNHYGSVSAKVKLNVIEANRNVSLEVTMHPPNLVIEQGKSALLRCNVTGEYSKLTWSKGDGLLSWKHEAKKDQLNISHATVEDQGTYFCIAKYKDVVARAAANVIVQKAVFPKLAILPKRIRNASVGDHVHFRCSVTEGKPVDDILWYKGKGSLLEDSKKQGNSSSDLVLEFQKVKKEDEGEYFCAAVNKAGFAKSSAVLKVSGKPRIVLTPRGTYNTSKGGYIIFECEASGYPVPKVEWVLPGNRTMKKATITSWPGYARIEMKETANASGKYICKATNVEGEATDWVTVRVNRMNLSPVVKVEPTLVIAISGQEVELKCNLSGVPTPEFAWIKLRRNARSVLLSKRNTLVLEDVQEKDEGTYACRAWNKFGTAEAGTRLRVTVPPTVAVSQTSVVILKGRSFRLHCKATGHPEPVINWTRPNLDTINAFEMNSQTLEVLDAGLVHAGTYKCAAKNIGGISFSYVNVTVLVPPVVLSSSDQENIEKLGENISFFCNVSGFPDPRIKWLKDHDTDLGVDGPILRLINLTSESQGQYKCIASNLAGQTQSVFSLAIKEVPTANIIEDIGTGSLVIPAGRNITLNCLSSGNPEPVVRWGKTEGRLPKSFMVEGGRLKVINASVDDAGTFRCTAFNSLGYVHADIRLIVQGAPTVEVYPKSMQVRIGKEARVSCSVTGTPSPAISWKKVDGHMPPHVIEGDQLVIPRVSSVDSGEYICIASNRAGSAEDQIKLRITDFLPRFSEDGLSYIIYGKILGALYQTKIEISFRPEKQDGILLYNGKPGADFVSLGMQRGYVVFQYNLGSGPSYIKSHARIDLFKWHTVIAYRDGLDGTLAVDSDPIVYGKSKGKYTGLNLNGDLFLGGYANLDVIKMQTSHNRGFTGCISQLLIAGKEFKIGADSLMMVGVTECNICLTQPCKNRGTCLAASSRYGYKCDCQPGFTGGDCQARVARCFPGACGPNGVCSDTENSEFRCKCPIGSYGERCQYGTSIRSPSFTNHSFMTFPGIKGAWEDLHIFIKFRPRLRDGLLLFNGGLAPLKSENDYVLIRLTNGYVQFEFNSGSGAAVIRHHELVSLNKWNTVEIERYQRYGSIAVNGKTAVKGSSPGYSITLNLGPLLFVGGLNASERYTFNKTGFLYQGFDGCIQDLHINDRKIDLVTEFISNHEVMDCLGTLTPCTPSHCRNDAKCKVVSAATYKCVCPVGFYGKHCESFTKRCGKVDGCKNGASCIRMDGNPICQCKLGFTGKGCEKAIKIGNEALFKGDGYLKFPRHILRTIELTSLQFDIRTKGDNGLLFWFGEQNDASNGKSPDFLSIGLKSGFLEVSYELGSGLAVILTKTPLNDNSWHTVKVLRSARNATLFIDGKHVAHTNSRGINTNLDIEAPMFFGGGKDVAVLTGQKYKNSYTGCIANVHVEDKVILLQDMAEDGRSVHPCTENSI